MTADSTSIYVGFAACVVSTVFFGSGFVPLKKTELKDGIHSQWIMCSAMYAGGLIIGIFDGYSHFYVLSMLAGALFSIANALSVWIISRTGIALAALFCSFPQLLTGWLCGRFGFFGIKVRVPNNEALNITGLLLSLLSAILYAFVKQHSSIDTDSAKVHRTWDYQRSLELSESNDRKFVFFVENLIDKDNIKAILASILAGLFYGLCFVPVIYIQDNWSDAPKSSLPYMFSFYCGAFAASTVFFIVYCLLMNEGAFVQSKSVVPSFLCGVFRVIAQTAFFLAIENLSETVTFPIITRFPSIITTLWGIVVFKEIQGKRNFIIVAFAIIVTVIGGLCSGLSKLL